MSWGRQQVSSDVGECASIGGWQRAGISISLATQGYVGVKDSQAYQDNNELLMEQ